MASHPPSICCTTGYTHTGTPTGAFITMPFQDTSVYVAEPPSSQSGPDGDSTTSTTRTYASAILLLPDVLGHRYINAQLLADDFARRASYLVVMPDLFHGDLVPETRPRGFSMPAWLAGEAGYGATDNGIDESGGTGRGHLPARVDPVVRAAIGFMRERWGVARIGVAGYCFGAKYVARFCGSENGAGKAWCSAGYMAHPSFVEEDELEGVQVPLSIAASEVDHAFTVERRHWSEGCLMGKSEREGLPWEMHVYSGVKHGFATRGDMKDQRQRRAKEKAFEQAVEWFDEHVKGVK